ncbi:MAG: DUF2813 domain-containing protein, partial [Cytophagaceae bacterium]
MKLQHIAVENYKGLAGASTKLDDFSCVIGENNAGKSTLLQSVLLLINGTRLSPHEYFDPKQEILITGSFSGLTDEIFEKIGEENKKKIEKYVTDTSITLARRYAIDGTSKLRIVTKIPSELKYRDEKIEEAFKGKKGKELGETLLAFYPEVSTIDERNAVTTQKAAKELIEKYHRQECSPEETEAVEAWLFSADSDEALQLPMGENKADHKENIWMNIQDILPEQPVFVSKRKPSLKRAFWSGAVAASLLFGIIVIGAYQLIRNKSVPDYGTMTVNNTSSENVRYVEAQGYHVAIGTN